VFIPNARAFRPIEETIFHPDGSRSVTGPLGTITYDADGTAHFEALSIPRLPAKGDHVRWDLAA